MAILIDTPAPRPEEAWLAGRRIAGRWPAGRSRDGIQQHDAILTDFSPDEISPYTLFKAMRAAR